MNEAINAIYHAIYKLMKKFINSIKLNLMILANSIRCLGKHVYFALHAKKARVRKKHRKMILNLIATRYKEVNHYAEV